MEPTTAFLPLLSLAISYLIGSIPTGFIAGKYIKGIDLREIGSGSTGATNVLRHVGKKAALIVFLIDVAKGIVPIVIAKIWLLSQGWQVVTGILALSGHIWPVWLNGKGGKAVATGLGVFLGISWKVGISALGVFLAMLGTSQIVSLSSISAAISLPIIMWASLKADNFSSPYFLASLAAMALILWRHRANIKRLRTGEEPKIGRLS